MKKLSVLLLAAVVALGAAAGNKIVNPKTTKINKKEAKELSLTKLTHKRGDSMKMKFNSLNEFTSVQHTKLASIKDAGTITWDFETEDQAAEWTIIDNDGDGYNWMYFNNTDLETGRMTAHSGEGLMTSASYDNDTNQPLTPDNWLISPQVTLTGKVGFYAMGQDASYAAEVFAIYVAVGTPNGLEDFVKISPDFTATGTYRMYECDLSAYEGMEGCIAIRHYNVTDMFMLNVDDVMIGEFESEPQPEMPTVITSVPEGCQICTYYRNSAALYQTIDWSTFSYVWTGGLTDGKVKVAFDNENGKAYIQNPLWYYDSYNTWVEGTYDEATGIISVPTGQYLSWDDAYGYGIQLFWGFTYVYEDADGMYLGQELDERTTEIQFMVEGDNLYLLGTEGDINAEFPDNFNTMGMVGKWSDEDGLTTVEFCNMSEDGNVLPFGSIVNIVPAVPADPIAYEWYDEGDESGYSYLYFSLPTTDVNGNPIDPEYLSYSIYLDNDQLFTFDYDTYYYDIDADMTEIPYEIWSGGYDMNSSYAYFYRTNAEGYEPLFTWRIGIQVFYTVDGVKNASNIVYVEVFDQPEEPVKTDAPSSTKENYVYNDGNMYYNAYTVTLTGPEGSDVYYRIGIMNEEGQYEYGEWQLYTGPFNVDEEGTYMIEAYAIAEGKAESDHIFDGFVVSKAVSVEELMASKTVSSVRYFNVAGQEMAQPSGMTIMVTTYTDGTTSAVKVVK